MGRIEFVVALFDHDQLRLYVESRVRVDLMLGWLPTDGAKLLECVGQDEHITLKRRKIDGV